MTLHTNRRSFTRAALLSASLAVGLMTGLGAQAQGTYPDKPIRFIVPFAPGGTTDARQFGQRLSVLLGPPVIIENKAVGGTMIGAEYVAKAPADGYTLLAGHALAVAQPAALQEGAVYGGGVHAGVHVRAGALCAVCEPGRTGRHAA